MTNDEIYKDLRQFAKKYKNHPKLPEAIKCVNIMMGPWKDNSENVAHACIQVVYAIEEIKISVNE